MQISEKTTALINEQINAELASAYLYQGIAEYYAFAGYVGFAKWFKAQAKEEVEHAEKFIDYLEEQGKKVLLSDIKAPSNEEYRDLREPLEIQLTHEEHVTALIYGIVAQAKEERDYGTERFLDWYVKEQVEEEANARALLGEYDLAKEHGEVLHLDSKLGKRE